MPGSAGQAIQFLLHGDDNNTIEGRFILDAAAANQIRLETPTPIPTSKPYDEKVKK